MTMLREAIVPIPKGDSAVSPWRTDIFAFSERCFPEMEVDG
jgi:hypothetical protein